MLLEKILESYPKQTSKIAHRILEIKLESKTCIYGASGIGKTNLILHYCTQEPFNTLKKLYINLLDVRLNPHKDLIYLKEFIENEKISVLILDHFTQDFNTLITPLKLSFIILIANTPCTLESFVNYAIAPLTFLEFHTLKKLPLSESLNLYLKHGNTLENLSEQKKGESIRNITRDYTEFWILRNLVLHLGRKISIHQIYTKLKKEGKLSKDRFYEYCKVLQNNQMLFFIHKFEHNLAPKKLFFWDFTLKNILSYERDFGLLFENMIFLELHYHFKAEVFYSDKLDFYIPHLSLGILCSPFTQNLKNRLNKIGKEREFCDMLLIITLNHEESGESLGMPYKALPFSVFATLQSNALSHLNAL